MLRPRRRSPRARRRRRLPSPAASRSSCQQVTDHDSIAAPTASTTSAGSAPNARGHDSVTTASAASPARRRPGQAPIAEQRRPWRLRDHRYVGAREAVAAAAHGLDQRVVAARLERLAQAADVHVHRALLDEHMVAPDLVEQLRARCARAPDGS